jgi:hypothetical protein
VQQCAGAFCFTPGACLHPILALIATSRHDPGTLVSLVASLQPFTPASREIGGLFYMESDMSENRQESDRPKRKAPKTAFVKGKSGNPGGRPPKTDEERTLEQMCKEKTPEALKTILELMAGSKMDRAKLAAAQYIIDRGWWKAKESVELSGGLNLSIAD